MKLGLAALKAHLAGIFAISATVIAEYAVQFQVEWMKLFWYIDWVPPVTWKVEEYLLAGLMGWLAVYWTPNIPKQPGDTP